MREVPITIYECDVCHLRHLERCVIERCERHHAKKPFFDKGDRVVLRGAFGAQVSGAVLEVLSNPEGHRINYYVRFLPDLRIEDFQIGPSHFIRNVDPHIGVLMNESELWPEVVR